MSGAPARLSPAAGPLRGKVRVPGDKSIAHRAVLLNAVGSGSATVRGLPDGRDVASTIAAMRACGVSITEAGPRAVQVRGSDMRLATPAAPIDCGNSGTTMRLLAGLLSGQGIEATLDGDASLRSRPMARVAEPLRAMGAAIACAQGGRAPLLISPAPLRAAEHRLPVASAQLKSALLLAGLQATGVTCVQEPERSRNHTEIMLTAMGVTLRGEEGRVCVDGPQVPSCIDVDVPGDPSSAAFFAVAAALVAGSRVDITGVCLNPTRSGFVAVLERMGVRMETSAARSSGGESVGDLTVSTGALRSVEIAPGEVPATIDELPVLAVAAAAADGVSVFRGVGELRVKESDRVDGIIRLLAAFGIDAACDGDDLTIRGGRLAGGTTFDPRGDHRMAMAAAVAALGSAKGVEVLDPSVASVSYPDFYSTLSALRGGGRG